MAIYFIIYFICAYIALFLDKKQQKNILLFIVFGVFLSFIIGFRYQVGGDWYNYLAHYEFTKHETINEILKRPEILHYLLNWIAAKNNWGVYFTNVIYGIIFTVGLIKFVKNEPYPWLEITVAIPYLFLVVSMGYSRQGVAIGLFMLAITYLRENKFYLYVILILIATLFHKTAILLLPLGVFLYGKNKILKYLMIVPIIYGTYTLFSSEGGRQLWQNYVVAGMISSGAKIRVAMTFLAALIFFYVKDKWKEKYNDYEFWKWISILSLVALVLVNFASTAVDRIALYFIPLQLVVFGRLPELLKDKIIPNTVKVLIVVYYFFVIYVWLNYATFSGWWIPYQNILLKDVF
ncbi:EpsG family protein [Caminibacter mediatlanticus]|uniref:EpsG family protein n=1 Tax=Caminibacter mediatlanticus TB-2 TaxID=391592 RepID=A0AAI9AG31_9BACT|nr:EpsG family protein [Caminibacter mediatlanticus]EDM22992.1 hypothetical protein CMTB2_04317 [Caminibacter mediatlanticus TB-2]